MAALMTNLRACVCLVACVAVSGCATVAGTSLESELASQVERARGCGVEDLVLGRPMDASWSMSRLRAAATSEVTQRILDEYEPILGRHAFLSRWPADRALLVGRLKLEVFDTGTSAALAAQAVEECIERAISVYPAAAWELRGRLNARRSEPESKSLAYYSFSESASVASNPLQKLQALRLRRGVVDSGFSSCNWRLANYYEAKAHAPPGTGEFGLDAPDDFAADYAASWFSSRDLDGIRGWTFANIPRCEVLSQTDFLKARNDDSHHLISTAFGQSEVDRGVGGEVCDALDFELMFNPNSTRSPGGPLGAFGEIFTNQFQMSAERQLMKNSELDSLLRQLLVELRSTLPMNAAERTAQHRLIVPLAPTLFAREFECRVNQHFDFGTPQRFEIDNTPSIVLSSATVRHAMLAATDAWYARAEPNIERSSDALRKRFKIELAFLVAHELAHAYLDGGRSLRILESDIDCHAAMNVVATYGGSATLGVFGSSGTAISEERFDVWRLWSSSTIQDVGDRIRLANEILLRLRSPERASVHCNVLS